MNNPLDEIKQQAQALGQLGAHYSSQTSLKDVPTFLAGRPLILTGMGASYHAAWNAALYINQSGFPATAVEASDLLHYGAAQFDHDSVLIYVSQSGESAEIAPLLERVGKRCFVIGVTNQPESTLARGAQVVLPLWADTETTIASKTYVNSLALLWLFARHYCGRWNDHERDSLDGLTSQAAQLLDNAAEITQRWLELLPEGQPVVFLGHGPHAATARHAAMTVAELTRRLSWSASIGAFRHGFIEAIQPDTQVVIFLADGAGIQSCMSLTHELEGYGARVALVDHGVLRSGGVTRLHKLALDEFLVPALNIIPVQLYASAYAEAHGATDGFRYISKVIGQL